MKIKYVDLELQVQEGLRSLEEYRALVVEGLPRAKFYAERLVEILNNWLEKDPHAGNFDKQRHLSLVLGADYINLDIHLGEQDTVKDIIESLLEDIVCAGFRCTGSDTGEYFSWTAQARQDKRVVLYVTVWTNKSKNCHIVTEEYTATRSKLVCDDNTLDVDPEPAELGTLDVD
jgi:hypothetical protein